MRVHVDHVVPGQILHGGDGHRGVITCIHAKAVRAQRLLFHRARTRSKPKLGRKGLENRRAGPRRLVSPLQRTKGPGQRRGVNRPGRHSARQNEHFLAVAEANVKGGAIPADSSAGNGRLRSEPSDHLRSALA